MIEASIKAVPGLVVTFLILAALVAAPTALITKANNKPWPLRTALATYLVGIVSVTLLPGQAGLESGQCDTGLPTHLLTSTSSLLNIALFAPGAFLAVLLFKRPVTVAAALGCLSGAVELIQSVASLGRSCSVTDLAANTTGAVVGSLAGALWLHRRRQPLSRPTRDLLWGTTIALLGTVVVGGTFHSRIDSVDVVGMDDQRKNLAESAVQADEWINAAAKGIYGSDTQVRETATERRGSRLKITAQTNRGNIAGWWPEKELESAWSSNTRGDEGNFSKQQVAAAADKFAGKWLPKNVAGSKQLIRSIGDGPTRAYVVAYRRYDDGVLLPMRLDLTVTTTGRIIGFTARTIEDPPLPSVTVDDAKARELAQQATGRPTESTLLLAQQIKGKWRPVWLVGSGKRDVAIDAATGELIAGGG